MELTTDPHKWKVLMLKEEKQLITAEPPIRPPTPAVSATIWPPVTHHLHSMGFKYFFSHFTLFHVSLVLSRCGETIRLLSFLFHFISFLPIWTTGASACSSLQRSDTSFWPSLGHPVLRSDVHSWASACLRSTFCLLSLDEDEVRQRFQSGNGRRDVSRSCCQVLTPQGTINCSQDHLQLCSKESW